MVVRLIAIKHQTKAAFKFRNNHESTRGTGKTKKIVGGKWISGPTGNASWEIPLKVEDTTLQVWNRNPKVSLDGEPSKRWGVMYFTLEKKRLEYGNEFN